MFEKQIKKLKQIANILKERGTLKEKNELIKLYLESSNKSNIYLLIMNASKNNLSLEEQIKLIEKVYCLKDNELNNIYTLLNDYLFKGSNEETNQIIDLYLNSCNKQKMGELLSNPFYMIFRTNAEIIELSTIYEEIMKTENYLSTIKEVQNSEKTSAQVYAILTNFEKIIEEDFTCEVQKQQIHNYLKSIDFNIIDFGGKTKTRC